MRSIPRRSVVNRFAIIFFVFILTTVAVFAEDFKSVRKRVIDGVWKRIGFVYVDSSVLLKDVGYNSNVYYFDNRTTPDWTADAGLQIDFSALVGKRFIIVIRESPYYSFFLKNKDLQFFNNKFSATIYTYLGRFNLMYKYGVSDMLSRPTVEFGSRVKTVKYDSEVVLDYGNRKRFFVEMSASRINLDYDDSKYFGEYDVAANLNMIKSMVSLTFNKTIFTRTLLFFRSEYFDLKFDSNAKKNGVGWVFSTGIKFPEVSILRGKFQIGVKYFTSKDSAVEKYIKPNGSGNISLKIAKRLKLNLAYTIDNYHSFYEPNQYFDMKRYSVGIDYYLGKNIKAGYNFSVGDIVYKKITGGKTGREDKTEISNFKLGVRFSGDMEIGIQYTHYSGKSTFQEFKRNFHFIGGYINHEF